MRIQLSDAGIAARSHVYGAFSNGLMIHPRPE
jgi:hypothetical protein